MAIIVHYLKKNTAFALVLLLLYGCTRNNDGCYDDYDDVINRVDNLITLLPEKETYNQGEQVILRLSIPSVNTYFWKRSRPLCRDQRCSREVGNELGFV